jgi:hypothetical protein
VYTKNNKYDFCILGGEEEEVRKKIGCDLYASLWFENKLKAALLISSLSNEVAEQARKDIVCYDRRLPLT